MEHFCFDPRMGEEWFTYALFYSEMVHKFPTDSHFVEIGSWKGMSASYMAVEIINSGKNIKFDCIDLWSNFKLDDGSVIDGNTVKVRFLENICPVKHIINVIHDDSVNASRSYEDQSVDFVFIDGDHSYEGCLRDIKAWLPKMKPNSILAGHDYAWSESVQSAVYDVFGRGNFSDVWGSGCFAVELIDGVPGIYKSSYSLAI